MKKTLKLASLLIVAALGLFMWSCSDDDDEKVIVETELPAQAKTFVAQYYPSVEILTVTKDKDHGVVEYDVLLKNGHEITFNEQGEWIEVDAPSLQTIPSGIAPTQIAEYVATNYPDAGINEIAKKEYGYEVELTNTIEMRFATNGSFLGLNK